MLFTGSLIPHLSLSLSMLAAPAALQEEELAVDPACAARLVTLGDDLYAAALVHLSHADDAPGMDINNVDDFTELGDYADGIVDVIEAHVLPESEWDEFGLEIKTDGDAEISIDVAGVRQTTGTDLCDFLLAPPGPMASADGRADDGEATWGQFRDAVKQAFKKQIDKLKRQIKAWLLDTVGEGDGGTGSGGTGGGGGGGVQVTVTRLSLDNVNLKACVDGGDCGDLSAEVGYTFDSQDWSATLGYEVEIADGVEFEVTAKWDEASGGTLFMISLHGSL